MVIGLLTLELHLPAAHSLKDKRQVLKSLQARLRNQFNVSVAEVDGQDNRQRAVIAVVCVATDVSYAHGLLTRAAGWVERTRLDCTLADYRIEIL
ncbi:MAG: DUF503 domain-containing protein [Caldilineae bacterium]|nr:MAG: DUF503 domain-containing protein [Caldilineae bacterium]